MNSKKTKLALIGLGKMGSVLANRLLNANFDLTVYNRTHEKMQPLIAAGAKGAQSAKDAASDVAIVITCLFDDQAVLETVTGKDGILAGLKPNAIHIGTSTILPSTSKKLSELHQNHHSIYLAGNVLGVPKAAAKGELTTIVAGEQQAIAQCTSVFNAYSSKIINVGEHAYKANLMKICCNYLLLTVIEAIGELYTFGEKSGLGVDVLNTMLHSVFAHPAYKLYVDKIKERSFDDVNFELKAGFKDVSLFQQAFIAERVVPDISNIVKNKFITALACDMSEKDWSAVTEITRMQAGLDTK